MAQADSIPPFPADIDRDAFGHWLSGFADGEACFFLSATLDNRDRLVHPRAQFLITLRADDFPILETIQSFFGCGRAYMRHNPTKTNPNPIGIYYASQINALASIVLPHFEAYPLRAKKRRDFLIFKEAVELLQTVRLRAAKAARINNRFVGGSRKWTDDERNHFVSLVNILKQQRKIHAEKIQIPKLVLPNIIQDDLFSSL